MPLSVFSFLESHSFIHITEKDVKIGQMLALPDLLVFQCFHFPLLISPLLPHMSHEPPKNTVQQEEISIHSLQ